jgi:hypothetical protein
MMKFILNSPSNQPENRWKGNLLSSFAAPPISMMNAEFTWRKIITGNPA